MSSGSINELIAFLLQEASRILVGSVMIWPLNTWLLDKFWRLAVTVAFAIP